MGPIIRVVNGIILFLYLKREGRRLCASDDNPLRLEYMCRNIKFKQDFYNPFSLLFH